MTEIRCRTCNRLLAKHEASGAIEIVCRSCKTTNTVVITRK